MVHKSATPLRLELHQYANTLNRVAFSRYDGASNFIGKTKALVVYKEALTDAQLQSLTTI